MPRERAGAGAAAVRKEGDLTVKAGPGNCSIPITHRSQDLLPFKNVAQRHHLVDVLPHEQKNKSLEHPRDRMAVAEAVLVSPIEAAKGVDSLP
jgi:hypothetical protein